MLASLQRFIALALLLSASAWAGFCIYHREPVLAFAGALVILLGYAIFLAIEFAMLSAVQSGHLAPRPTARQLLGAWWGEVVTAPAVFLWRQPFRSHAEPDNAAVTRSETEQPTHGVVFVHGFVCNRAFWNPWLRKFRSRGLRFIAIDLEPLFGPIEDYADRIEAAVKTMEAATRLPVVLVGHSMGGMAIRAWLSKFESDARVHRVITIGSPHHGTWLARYGRTANGKQMRQDSAWITELASRESPPRYALFTCFFGHCDNIVFPAESAILQGALNIHVPATAHVRMAFERPVIDEVLRWLPATSSAAH